MKGSIPTWPWRLRPIGEAGLFDAGPLVGLWYIVLSARVLFAARAATGHGSGVLKEGP